MAPKINPEMKMQIRYAFRHPVKFMKGADLPFERVRPWELATHMLTGLVGIRAGFFWQDMWLFQNLFHMPPSIQAVGQTVSGLFDGLNDPLIGAFMDTRSYKLNVHRWIVRINTIMSPIMRVLPMFNFGGISHAQRIGLFIACRCLNDLTGTPAGVSGTKLIVHTTGDSEQRRKINWAQGISTTIHEMLAPLIWAVIGLREVFGWSEYGIIVLGAVIFAIPGMLLELGPTFIIQRVPDHIQPKTGFGIKGVVNGIIESFRVTWYNRYFWLDNFSALARAVLPGVSEQDFYRYSNIDDVVNLGGARGEFLLFLRDNIVSLPQNILMPFALPIIRKVGGPRNMQVLHEGISTVCNAARAAVGVHTFPRFLFHTSMEMFIRTFGRVQEVSGRMNQFEMLDYVEYKTGRRSEGANMAVNGLKNKFITNNIDAITGRLFLQFVLGFDPARGIGRGLDRDLDGNPIDLPGQTETYIRYMPLMYLWMPVLRTFIVFVSRLLYRYPAELRVKVEAELAERRRLTEEAKEAIEV